MKRIIFVLLTLVVMTAGCLAGNRNVKTKNVISTISEYTHEPGFEVVSIGKLGLGLAKMLGNLSAETEEDKAAIAILNGINKLVVVDYEDAPEDKRKAFDSRLAKALENAEKIIEVKDEEDTVNIYGTSARGGESIDDLMIYIPGDCTLVCILGSISAERIADLIKMTNE